MAKLREFNRVVVDFASMADFCLVYVQEAHATDGWSMKNNYNIRYHRTLEERLSAAQILADSKPPCPVLVDNMADEVNKKYGVVSERLYIILNGRVVYKGRYGPAEYSVAEVAQWLEAYKQSVDKQLH
ncbi:hypothetical protein V1264_016675 [Littorina saxatilis]|uniref:Iodothyronine deiodinase n=3 Tax=Littorina saxatilis TaxID=31220 RepID=A0AAN9BHF6_9CAEN